MGWWNRKVIEANGFSFGMFDCWRVCPSGFSGLEIIGQLGQPISIPWWILSFLHYVKEREREAWGVYPVFRHTPNSDISMARNWWFNPLDWIGIAYVFADIPTLVFCEPQMGFKPTVSSAGPGHSCQRPGKSTSLGQQRVDHALSTLGCGTGWDTAPLMGSIFRMPKSMASDSFTRHFFEPFDEL